MVLACVDLSNEHVSPLSFAASNHCQRGSSARETSARNKRRFCFPPSFCFSFCFVFFGLVLVGHKTSQSKVSFDFMLDLFCCFVVLLSLALCDIDACVFVRLKKKKKCGDRIIFFRDVFS